MWRIWIFENRLLFFSTLLLWIFQKRKLLVKCFSQVLELCQLKLPLNFQCCVQQVMEKLRTPLWCLSILKLHFFSSSFVVPIWNFGKWEMEKECFCQILLWRWLAARGKTGFEIGETVGCANVYSSFFQILWHRQKVLQRAPSYFISATMVCSALVFCVSIQESSELHFRFFPKFRVFLVLSPKQREKLESFTN